MSKHKEHRGNYYCIGPRHEGSCMDCEHCVACISECDTQYWFDIETHEAYDRAKPPTEGQSDISGT